MYFINMHTLSDNLKKKIHKNNLEIYSVVILKYKLIVMSYIHIKKLYY